MVYIAPLNLFLYTWRFLRELEQSVSNKVLKIICRGFEIFTIAVLPVAFYAILTVYIYLNGEYTYYGAKLEIKKATHVGHISTKLGLVLTFLNPIVAVLSCLILGMVVFLVLKLSRQVRVGKNAVAAKRQINVLVTVSHIVVALTFTITEPMSFNIKNGAGDGAEYFRILSA